jgi:hypothetical protein
MRLKARSRISSPRCAGAARGARWLAGALLCSALVTAATGQNLVIRSEGTEIPPELPDESEVARAELDSELLGLAERLDDPSYEVREETTRMLMGMPFHVVDYCVVLSQPDLSAEQRYRLLMLLEHRLLYEPRGALGISMEPPQINNRGGVVIADLVPGLPAEKVLRVGDRITAIDSRRVSTGNDLVVIVQLKRPGEEVQLDIERPQQDDEGNLLRGMVGEPVVERLNVTVELASVHELTQRSRTGQVNELVRMARMDEALEASLRYGPLPRVATIRAGEGMSEEALEDVWNVSVETDPMIEELKQELDRVRSGQLGLTDARRLRWMRQLQELKMHSIDPSVSEQDRDYARRLAQRYQELLPR